MRRLGWAVLVVVLAVAVAASVLYGQAERTAPGGRAGTGTRMGGMSELDRAKMVLMLLDLTPAEEAATTKTIEAKVKARQALEVELGKLRDVANNPQATEAQVSTETAAYTKAMAAYRTMVQKEDAALAKQLSVRSKAKCLAAGVLDNAIGAGGRRMGAGGGGRMGGPGGGMGGPGGGMGGGMGGAGGGGGAPQ